MWDGIQPGPQYEKLSQAIIHAILSSNEVKSQVADLQNGGGLDGEDIIALALRFPPQGGLEARVELMRRAGGGEGESDVEDELGADLEEDLSKPASERKVKFPGLPKRTLSPNESEPRAFSSIMPAITIRQFCMAGSLFVGRLSGGRVNAALSWEPLNLLVSAPRSLPGALLR